MNVISTPENHRTGAGEPTWEIAYLFPLQGTWTEEEYLALETNHLVEFSDGYLEVLPMPTTSHQFMVAYLYGLLLGFVSSQDLGRVVFSPLKVRVSPKKYREPDVVFMRKEHADRIGDDYWEGADLVMEVVSGDKKDRERDLEKKTQDYAKGGIPEYWIIDPEQEKITVLHLHGKKYSTHGEFKKGETATSPTLPGFAVEVSTVFAQQLPKKSKSGRKLARRKK